MVHDEGLDTQTHMQVVLHGQTTSTSRLSIGDAGRGLVHRPSNFCVSLHSSTVAINKQHLVQRDETSKLCAE